MIKHLNSVTVKLASTCPFQSIHQHLTNFLLHAPQRKIKMFIALKTDQLEKNLELEVSVKFQSDKHSWTKKGLLQLKRLRSTWNARETTNHPHRLTRKLKRKSLCFTNFKIWSHKTIPLSSRWPKKTRICPKTRAARCSSNLESMRQALWRTHLRSLCLLSICKDADWRQVLLRTLLRQIRAAIQVV
jgi:hypothetical protein